MKARIHEDKEDEIMNLEGRGIVSGYGDAIVLLTITFINLN